ncbi:MAG TPA: tetratricopeptide repeat protein, partial [Gemmataceae bacterium]|nr:tetratricopeptide repeat protein [Gemmataceae bacterium]
EPDTARLHHNLGNVLFNCGYLKEADAEFSQALALDSSQPLAHFGRGSLLRMVGRKNEALEEFRRAVALDPNFFHAQNAMSETLLELGLFNEAEASTRRALEMLPANHPLRSELLNRQKSVAQLRSLEDKLPSILAGKADLVNVNEQFGRAWLCQLPRLRHYTVAARLYTLAFAAMPIPATDPRNAYFHLAACAAAKAGTGADEGNASLGEAERSRLREQALDWLRHELAFCIKRAQSSSTTEQRTARRTLHQWQLELDLSCVRDPAALAKLPETERSAWQEFWQEVERTLVTPPLGSLSIASHR